jgi:ABC-type uncharacterized transport system permease subunit
MFIIGAIATATADITTDGAAIGIATAIVITSAFASIFPVVVLFSVHIGVAAGVGVRSKSNLKSSGTPQRTIRRAAVNISLSRDFRSNLR